jgi:hypothetical protein
MKRVIGVAFSMGVLALGAQLVSAALASPLPSAVPGAADVTLAKMSCLANNIRCRAPFEPRCVREKPADCCHRWACRRPHHKNYSSI